MRGSLLPATETETKIADLETATRYLNAAQPHLRLVDTNPVAWRVIARSMDDAGRCYAPHYPVAARATGRSAATARHLANLIYGTPSWCERTETNTVYLNTLNAVVADCAARDLANQWPARSRSCSAQPPRWSARSTSPTANVSANSREIAA